MDRATTSGTVAQQIHFVTHHSVSAPTILHRLQQSGMSAGHPLLRLPLTGNPGRSRRQWCDERRAWTIDWNNIVLTHESQFFLHYHEGRIRIELLPWVACSPDLSPIENVWFRQAQRLARDTPPAATLD
ncbi:transposable element Tcb1 transposase [Trichonephila clavipes]|nr:transposable element Tcb1 transposase [Trichonephila clavipes]